MIINLPKRIDEIEEPELMPDDWYVVRLTEEPKIEQNKKKTGNNLVLTMRVQSDNPKYNGRPFRRWLSLPTEEDKEQITARGGTLEDLKLQQLGELGEAFSGEEAEGDSIELHSGMEAEVYVIQTVAQDGQNFVNEIDWSMGVKIVTPF